MVVVVSAVIVVIVVVVVVLVCRCPNTKGSQAVALLLT